MWWETWGTIVVVGVLVVVTFILGLRFSRIDLEAKLAAQNTEPGRRCPHCGKELP